MTRVTSGVDRWGAYLHIDEYDPPPGQRGWYKSMRSAVGANGMAPADIERWRRATVRSIRRLMKKLKQPDGTNFHQLIRVYRGEPVTEQPERGPSREAEDCRLITEFEWEARQRMVHTPATLEQLLAQCAGTVDA